MNDEEKDNLNVYNVTIKIKNNKSKQQWRLS